MFAKSLLTKLAVLLCALISVSAFSSAPGSSKQVAPVPVVPTETAVTSSSEPISRIAFLKTTCASSAAAATLMLGNPQESVAEGDADQNDKQPRDSCRDACAQVPPFFQQICIDFICS